MANPLDINPLNMVGAQPSVQGPTLTATPAKPGLNLGKIFKAVVQTVVPGHELVTQPDVRAKLSQALGSAKSAVLGALPTFQNHVRSDVYNAYPFNDAAKAALASVPIQQGGQRPEALSTFWSSPASPHISLSKRDASLGAAESFNALYDHQKIDPNAFNQAWEAAKRNDADGLLGNIEDVFVQHPDLKAPNGNLTADGRTAGERYGYLGMLAGRGGLSKIPPELRPFYQGILAPGPVQKPDFAQTPGGVALNTVTGLPAAAFGVAKDIAQGTLRSFISLGNTLAENAVPGVSRNIVPVPPDLQKLLGATEIRDLPTQREDIKTAIQNSPTAKKLGLDKMAGPLSFGAILGQSALDYTPFGVGGEGAAVKTLAKETDQKIIAETLGKMGVTPELAAKFSPELAQMSDPKEVKNVLDMLKGSNAMHKAAQADIPAAADELKIEPTAEEGAMRSVEDMAAREKALTGSEPVPPTSSSIPDHIQPLVEEAKNYKTADEFASALSKEETRYSDTIKPTAKIGEVPLSRFDGEDIVASQNTVDRAGVDKWKQKIEAGDRPLVTVDFSERRGSPIVQDGHTRLTAYKEAGVENIPVADNSGGRVVENGVSLQEIHAQATTEPALTHETSLQEETPSTAPVAESRGTKDVGQLQNMLSRVEQSIAIAKKDPEGFAKAYGPDRMAENEARAQTLRDRITTVQGENRTLKAADDPLAVMAGEKEISGPGGKEMTADLRFAKPPAATLTKLAKGEEGKSWTSLLKGYSDNLPKEKKVHFFDALSTPEFVLEKLGLQKGAELLQNAKDVYRVNKKEAIDKILAWKKEVETNGKPYSKERIFRYLDGDARYAKGEMTDTELKVATEIKSYLKEWADRLNLPEESRLTHYVTHIFDNKAKDLDLPTESAFDDPDLAVIMDSTPARSVYNPFLEKRQNKPGYKEDIWASLDAYVKRATRKEAMDPALESLSDMASKLDGASYEYVTKLTHRINMRPTDTDHLLDNFITEKFGRRFTERPTAYITKKIRTMFYRGTLGLNVSSALRNLSQGANTYAKLGEKYTVIGYTKLLSRLVTRNLNELYDVGVLDESLDQDRKIGVYKSFLQKADPYLFVLFDLGEKINRGAAYYGAKSKAINRGLAEEDAIRYAKRIVRETQFAFGAVDTPTALASDISKTLLQLQSYNVKQTEFLARMLKNKEYAGLIRWSVSALGFVFTVGRLFGMKPEQLIPTVGVGGSLGGSPFLTSLQAIATLPSSNTTTHDKAVSDLQRTMWSSIPAGVQAKKTLQGLDVYSRGKDTTPAGNLRYRVPKDKGTLIRAALFGKSALPQAQKYYDRLNNKGKKKTPTKGGANPLNK